MTETETIVTNKPWYNRVMACLCAILVCCLVVFVGFSIPKVSADGSTFLDQYETYIDTVYSGTGGASLSGNSVGSKIDGWQLGIDYAKYCLEHPDPIGANINTNIIHTLIGYFYVSGDSNKHVARCAFAENYFPQDGLDFVVSDTYNLKIIATSTSNYSVSCGFDIINGNSFPYVSMSSASATQVWDAYDSMNFFSYGWRNYNMPGTFGYCRSWCATQIPTLTSGTNVDHALRVSSRGSDNPSAYPFGNSDISTIEQFSDVPALSNHTLTLDNIDDFYMDVFTPYIEEEYPEYVQYLFVYVEPPTETQAPSGCGCHVDVYVEPTIIVEPTINVYVNPWELPSDEQDYTLPTIPAHETIPFPTQDSSNTELVTMPTMDLEEFQQTYQNAFDFWFYCAEQLIQKMHLQIILAFAFVITVVGFIMWRLGG